MVYITLQDCGEGIACTFEEVHFEILGFHSEESGFYDVFERLLL
jgi:hypothetical protein